MSLFDFRLEVFDTVANRLSFTKAADELNITQPAVSKHIKAIEEQLNVRLFERNGTHIKLTSAGEILQNYTQQLASLHREMEFEISQLNQKHKGHLRIGASINIAQYFLPPLLAGFRKRFNEIELSLRIQNTEAIEELLTQNKIDLGLTEGHRKNNQFKYRPFVKDEIVPVVRANHPLAQENFITVSDLRDIPLVMRESGSGTLETINHNLKTCGLPPDELNIDIRLGNTESIKSYLLHSDSMAFLSIHSVLKELNNSRLCVVDVKELSIERYFYFIQPKGGQSSIRDLFLSFARRYNLK